MIGRGEFAGGTEERAQSNAVAVVLLAVLVIAGASVVVLAGSSALDQSRGDVSLSATEQSMLSLDEQIQQLSSGEISKASIEVGGSGDNLRMLTSSSAESGVMEITAGSTTKTYTLGTIKYEQDGKTVAYQGGGVFQKTSDGSGSVSVSPPPVSYRMGTAGTLNFPVVQVRGSASGTKLNVETVEKKSLLSDLGLSKPLPSNTRITVEIRSEFYEAWAQKLKDEVGEGPVSTNPSQQKVTVRFKSPKRSTSGTIRSAAYSPGPTGTANSGSQTDSYTSPNYPASSTWPNNKKGHIRSMGTIEWKNHANINGQVHSLRGADIIKTSTSPGRPGVTGEVRLGCCGSPSTDGTTIKGDQGFRSDFSTKDDLNVQGNTKFDSDLMVGGDHSNSVASLRAENGRYFGNVFVDGDAEVGGSSPVFHDAMYVRGDLDITSKGDTDDLYVDGDVTINTGDTLQTTIDGDIVATGSVTLGSKVTVTGDVVYGTSLTNRGTIRGSKNNPSNPFSANSPPSFRTPKDPMVPKRSPADGEIDSKASLSSSTNNDNSAASGVDTNGNLVGCSGSSSSCVLGGGDYYVKKIDLNSRTHTLKIVPGGNTVDIFVEEYVHVKGTIKVVGNGRVNFWIDGQNKYSTGSGDKRDLYVHGSDSKVITTDGSGNKVEAAPRIWMYLNKGTTATGDTNAELSSGARFTGVIYAPGEERTVSGTRTVATKGADVTVKASGTEVYGAIVGHIKKFGSDPVIHYDENLGSTIVFPGGPGSSTASVSFADFTQQTASVEG